jgi:hypothetical protein
LTDIADVDGKLFDKGVSGGDFLALLSISEDHFLEGIPELNTSVFQVFPFSNHLGPFHQLAHVARFDPGVLGGKINEHGMLFYGYITIRDARSGGGKGKSFSRGGPEDRRLKASISTG